MQSVEKHAIIKQMSQDPRSSPKENILIQIHACEDNFEETNSILLMLEIEMLAEHA